MLAWHDMAPHPNQAPWDLSSYMSYIYLIFYDMGENR